MQGFDKTEWYRDLGLLLAVGIGIFVGNVNGYCAGEEGRNMFGMLAGSAAGSAFSIGAFYLWHVYRAKKRAIKYNIVHALFPADHFDLRLRGFSS